MSIQLEIRDGTPNWWNSPDLWVVPGSDPTASPAQPIAGMPAYLWARVKNKGSTPANGAQVKFYWSNPATGVLRSNSTFIGSAFVDLSPGESQDVLCLTPWIPVVVNEGHECIVGEIIHSGDPLPSPLPDDFSPPAYAQVAQRNLSVLAMKSKMMILPIQLSAPPRENRALEVAAQLGGEIDRQSLKQLGLADFELSKRPMVHADLSMTRQCEKSDIKNRCPHLHLDIKRGTSRVVYLKVATEKMEPNRYATIDIVARDKDKVVGGVTYLAISEKEN